MRSSEPTLRGRGAASNPANRFEEIAFLPDGEARDPEDPGPRTQILRDAKQAMTAPAQLTESGDGTTTATGIVPLASLEPGNYILRIVARPPQGNEIAASQWTDFEVLP